MKKGLLGVFCLAVVGCSVTPLESGAENVTIVFDNTVTPQSCEPIDTWVGSEGHWYSYWFITNFNLTTGALNQLRNHAIHIGGNRIEISPQMEFETSVTFIGHIYDCP
ncbi:DUF4156 domain-containing protein [Thaumasiovibrio subtropicus]|uniref:DUF4156 domain-containing protein n=1 Tax=Thaumasiovibrio subtropicus TaxID=1891207 RepID=UPI000B361225|nr:DUF4156 domain-containing protein [Thaumasiovibrio subtropicus]